MTPVEPINLTVYRGDNKEFESEGFYEVQVFSTDDGTINMPFIGIQAREY